MNPSEPLVSIICLVHNHGKYLEKAIASVEGQTYSNTELILVDDGSTDDSKIIMREIAAKKGYLFIDIAQSIGNCAAFNKGFFASRGSFIIDLAADDVLHPDRILHGLESFKELNVGVEFCDVEFINSEGFHLGYHYERNSKGELLNSIPTGDIYQKLIQQYFICPPSMMIRRKVLEEMVGYDESLSFEDFDFWIRSARSWHYKFRDEILVKRRILSDSLSRQQTTFRNKHQRSVLEVCKKIQLLNRSDAEKIALRKRCRYEIRQCIRQGNLELIPDFIRLAYFH